MIQSKSEGYSKVEEKVMVAWRISRGIGLVIMLALIFGIAILNQKMELIEKVSFIDSTLLTLILKVFAGVCIGYNILGIMFFPWIEYCQWGYRITDDKVEIRKGIIFLETMMIPIVRIQHISMSQGPIFRALGLYKVEISVATRSFEITGIKKQTAETIVDSLKEKLYTRLEGEGITWKKKETSDQLEEV